MVSGWSLFTAAIMQQVGRRQHEWVLVSNINAFVVYTICWIWPWTSTFQLHKLKCGDNILSNLGDIVIIRSTTAFR